MKKKQKLVKQYDPYAVPKEPAITKILSSLSITLAIIAIGFAVITDITTFKDQLLSIFSGIVLGTIAFIAAITALLMSLILLFGIALLQYFGFWPVAWAHAGFNAGVIGQQELNPALLNQFCNFRIVIIVLLIIAFVVAIIALFLNQILIHDEYRLTGRGSRFLARSTISISSFGILVSAFMFVLVKFIIR